MQYFPSGAASQVSSDELQKQTGIRSEEGAQKNSRMRLEDYITMYSKTRVRFSMGELYCPVSAITAFLSSTFLPNAGGESFNTINASLPLQ
jgi:hypothetical protein